MRRPGVPPDLAAERPRYVRPMTTQQTAFEPARVLLADARAPCRAELHTLLAEPGLDLAEAPTPADALALLAGPDFAAALVALHGDGSAGFTLAAEARARSTPVIFLADTDADPAWAMRAYALGAVDFLVRPLVPGVVRAKVAALVELFRRAVRTGRREREERLADEQRALVESIPDIAFVTRPDGGVEYVNQRWYEFSGRTPEETLGFAWIDALHPDDRDRLVAAWAGAAAAGEQSQGECRLRGRSGGYRWFLGRAVPLRVSGGAAVRYVGTLTDIDERRRAEAELRESEERFRLAAEAVNGLIYDSDLVAGRVLRTRGLFEVAGYRPEEVPDSGAWWPSIMHPDDRPNARAQFERAVAAGDRYEVHYRVRHKAGHFVHLVDRGMAVRDAAGRVVRLVGCRTDESDTVRAAARGRFLARVGEVLGGSLDLGQTLAAVARLAVPDLGDYCVVVARGDDGRLRQVALAHVDPAQEAVLREIFRDFCPDDAPSSVTARVAATGRSELFPETPPEILRAIAAYHPPIARVETELRPRSAMYVPLVAAGRSLGCLTLVTVMDSGRVLGPDDLAFAEDVARRAALAVEHARLFSEVSASDRRKDEFLAMLAHELRNPLAPVRSGLQVLRLAGTEPGVLAAELPAMERQVAQMVRLIEDLIDVSRINHGKVELRRQEVELAAVVGLAVETSRPQIEAGGHLLELTLPEEPLWLDADPTRLAQVLANLLNNAAKYSDDGGRITLSASAEGGEAVVRVRDTGIGIPPEVLPRVFDMFAQGGGAAARTPGGLGVGLTLVRQLVELHGGRVEGHSRGRGTGSEFVVRLPLAEGRAEEVGSCPSPLAPRRLKVLVVDDNADAANSLAAYLRLTGHAARAAYSGAAGLEAAAAEPPDVVLLDLGMPGLDGYAVAARLRRSPATAGATLVALTGWGAEEDRRRTREAGFDAHLVKPVDPVELSDLLGRLRG
jgi:PAS domain S-box-containing protein